MFLDVCLSYLFIYLFIMSGLPILFISEEAQRESTIMNINVHSKTRKERNCRMTEDENEG